METERTLLLLGVVLLQVRNAEVTRGGAGDLESTTKRYKGREMESVSTKTN